MSKKRDSVTKRRPLKNIFSDRSSLVLRALMREPDKKWTVADFVKEGVSIGLASDALSRAEAKGYVERVVKGPKSYSRLIRKDTLLKDWTNAYSFEQNNYDYYLSTDKDFLRHCCQYLKQKKVPHALTLYSASRLISPYVKDDRNFIYIDIEHDQFLMFLKDMETQLGLYKLIQGGNVCFVIPFYRSSVFRDLKIVKGYPLVSNLQLYLDLMTFPPTGTEEAEHLISYFKKKGQSFV